MNISRTVRTVAQNPLIFKLGMSRFASDPNTIEVYTHDLKSQDTKLFRRVMDGRIDEMHVYYAGNQRVAYKYQEFRVDAIGEKSVCTYTREVHLPNHANSFDAVELEESALWSDDQWSNALAMC